MAPYREAPPSEVSGLLDDFYTTLQALPEEVVRSLEEELRLDAPTVRNAPVRVRAAAMVVYLGARGRLDELAHALNARGIPRPPRTAVPGFDNTPP